MTKPIPFPKVSSMTAQAVNRAGARISRADGVQAPFPVAPVDPSEILAGLDRSSVAIAAKSRVRTGDDEETAGDSDHAAEAKPIEGSLAGSSAPLYELAQASPTGATAAADSAAAQGASPAVAAPAAPASLIPGVLVGVGGLGLIIANRDKSTPTTTGKVVDGYIAGATVFIDVNRNGQPDAGEPTTQSDAQGNFTLPQGVDGPVVAFGGRDVTTGVDFTGILKAPAGSTVVTPLTTLVAELMQSKGASLAAAQEQVLDAVGLSTLKGKVDLTKLDPVAGSAANTAGALDVQKAGVIVATMVNSLAVKVQQTAGATTDKHDEIAAGIFSEVAKTLTAGALAADKIVDTASAVVNSVAAQAKVGGISVSGDTLKSAAVSALENLSAMSSKISSATSVDSVASGQKTALTQKTFTLQLLHYSDGEAGTLASTTAPRLAALVDRFEDAYPNSITLAGGDNFIPGPFLAAGTDPALIAALNSAGGGALAATATVPIAAIDIAIHNAIGVEASALGNHEFDLGSRVLSDAIKGVSGAKGAQFPYVSANLDFSGDSDLNPLYVNTVAASGLELASSQKGKIVPSAILVENGAKIGLVGVTTQILEAIASPSGTEVMGFPKGSGPNGEFDDMTLLATQLQPVVDDLTAQGVNKIVLLSHLQILGNEKLLATKLSGVDIVVAAGSHTRIGDSTDTAVAMPGHPATFAESYPFVARDKDGGTTLVVSTDNEYTYLGRLVVDFDEAGKVIPGSVTTNASINGAYAATDATVAATWGVAESALATTAFASGTRGGSVKALTDAVQSVITVKDGNVFGYASVYLEGERTAVRSEETNLGNLSADANLFAAKQALGAAAPSTWLVSLKNGGGIRAQIGMVSDPKADGSVDKLPPSDNTVSLLDVENSLRFNNQLMVFDTTPEGLKAILEHGVAAGTLQGRFPQIGGVSFSWDPDFTAGARVMDVALIAPDGTRVGLYDNGAKLANVPAKISVVTLNYLANGGDSYPIKANGDNFRYLADVPGGGYVLSAPVPEALDYTAAATIAQYASAPVAGISVDPEAPFGAFGFLVPTADRAAFREIIGSGERANNGYVFNGTPDGIGVLDNGDGTLKVLINHEFGSTAGDVRAHGSKGAYVSELTIDKATLTVLSGKDFLQSANGLFLASADGTSWSAGASTAFNRFCSGDLAAESAFKTSTAGYAGRIYLTGEESGAEGRAFAHIVSGADAGKVYELPSLGNLSFENLVANPVAQTKTVVAALDDSSVDGQLYFYVGDKGVTGTGNAVQQAGLAGGKLFGVKVGTGTTLGQEVGALTAPTETGLGLLNGSSTFSLVDLGDVKGKTGAQINDDSKTKLVTNFLRPEDGAWSADGKTFFFVTTASTTTASRLWSLEFTNAATPESGGTIRMLLDGSEGQVMMDNLTVAADGTLLLQEDPGANDRLAKIWRYNPGADTLVEIAQHDPALFVGANKITNDEESSGVVEITSMLTGVVGYDTAKFSYFMVADQIHKAVASPASQVEMGQLAVMAVAKTSLSSEQSAFRDYMKSAFGTPASAFDQADTPAALDERIQNLNSRVESVLQPSQLAMSKVGTFSTNVYNQSGAEIVAYDAGSKRLFLVNAVAAEVQVINAADPANPVLVGKIDFRGYATTSGTTPQVNSVAVSNGMVAVAVADANPTAVGKVVLFKADIAVSTTAAAPAGARALDAGVGPDMVTFSPDGKKVLVANEAEAINERATTDAYYNGGAPFVANGGITVVTLGADPATAIANASAQQLDFTAYNGQEGYLRERGVRIAAGTAASNDLEPEYIAVSPDGKQAMVTLQENNAVAVLDLSSTAAKIVDIVPLGYKNHARGDLVMTAYDTMTGADLPSIGNDAFGRSIPSGGFSGLQYIGTSNGKWRFLTVSDRGPNGEPVNVDADAALERPFLLPSYQARVSTLEFDPATKQVTIVGTTMLTRADGTPLTGLPNIPGTDEEPVQIVPATDAARTGTFTSGGVTLGYKTLSYDQMGADLEGVYRTTTGNMWMVDEYRPAIYEFDAAGKMVSRYVPSGTAALTPDTTDTFGTETLPAHLIKRQANRGFEALAVDDAKGLIFAFVQSPLDSVSGNSTDTGGPLVRIEVMAMRDLAIGTALPQGGTLAAAATKGTVIAEYAYLLERPALNLGALDKIGDAAFNPTTGTIFVFERDSSVAPEAKKVLYEIDLRGATNLLTASPTLPTGKTALEVLTVDELLTAGINPVYKERVANLPSLGFLPNDKAEGLALLPDGSLAVINDNDFGVNGVGTETVGLGIFGFNGANRIDSDNDTTGQPSGTIPAVSLTSPKLYGAYMPDGIASFSTNGKTYYITANEGDSRTFDEVQIKDLGATGKPVADSTAGASLLDGDLKVITNGIDVDGDGDLDKLVAFGGRSFSILDAYGNRIYDSGDQLERLVSEVLPTNFNANHTSNTIDNRSDDKGPEPEGVTTALIGDKVLAFVGLERIGGVAVYDVSDPYRPSFVSYENTRDFTKAPGQDATTKVISGGDLGPEGLIVIPASSSPSGLPMVAVANEVSGTVGLFNLAAMPANETDPAVWLASNLTQSALPMVPTLPVL